MSLRALALLAFAAGPLRGELGDFEVCFNRSSTLQCQQLAALSSNEPVAFPTVWLPDLRKVMIQETECWVPSFRNLTYPAPGQPNTMEITLRWRGGSVSRTVSIWYANPSIGFDMAIPVQKGFYFPTPVELQVTLRDSEGVAYDSTRGLYFNLLAPLPEPETWMTMLCRIVGAALKLLRLNASKIV